MCADVLVLTVFLSLFFGKPTFICFNKRLFPLLETNPWKCKPSSYFQPAQQAFAREFVKKVRTSARKRNEGGGGGQRTKLFSPGPAPSIFYFFHSRSKFRTITLLETLATQAKILPNCSKPLLIGLSEAEYALRPLPIFFEGKRRLHTYENYIGSGVIDS